MLACHATRLYVAMHVRGEQSGTEEEIRRSSGPLMMGESKGRQSGCQLSCGIMKARAKLFTHSWQQCGSVCVSTEGRHICCICVIWEKLSGQLDRKMSRLISQHERRRRDFPLNRSPAHAPLNACLVWSSFRDKYYQGDKLRWQNASFKNSVCQQLKSKDGNRAEMQTGRRSKCEHARIFQKVSAFNEDVAEQTSDEVSSRSRAHSYLRSKHHCNCSKAPRNATSQ